MSTLTWEQKLAALNGLSECSLKMREPGNWYVSQPTEVKEREGDGVLVGRYGNGATPEAAVEDHFDSLTERKPLAYVVVTKFGVRYHVRWNGFMWVELWRSGPSGSETP